MLTKDQYSFIVQYKPICEMMAQHGIYVGGANPLFDYLEAQGLTGGELILRSCQGCIAGFLKWTYSMITLYEKQQNN